MLSLFLLSILNFSQANDAPLVVTNYFLSPLGQFDNDYPEEKYDKFLQKFKDIYGPIIEQEG